MKEKLFIALAWLPKATVQAAIGGVAFDAATKMDPENVNRQVLNNPFHISILRLSFAINYTTSLPHVPPLPWLLRKLRSPVPTPDPLCLCLNYDGKRLINPIRRGGEGGAPKAPPSI